MSFTGMYLKPGFQPFENQKRNIKALIHRRKALLSDRVGSGKTMSILYSFAYLKEQGALNTLVVLTPLSAYEKEVWKKDIQKFTKLSCISLDELASRCPDVSKLPNFLSHYDVVYGKHTHVKSLNSLLSSLVSSPLTLLTLDEVHAFRNQKSSLTLQMKALCLLTPFLWGITGSSISKSMEDLYSIVNLISPWFFGPFSLFRDYFCEVREKPIGRGPNGKLRKALEIVGVKANRESELETKLAPLLIKGESFLSVHFHYIDYNLSSSEQALYSKIANGITLNPSSSSEDWLSYLLTSDDPTTLSIKDVERFSSRFIYLSYAADGILSSTGKFINTYSTKIDLLISSLKSIVSKGQSVIVYFDYLAPLNLVEQRIQEEHLPVRVLRSTGESVLDASSVTENSVKKIPHIILGTRASSESASYYFINNIIFFHVPTIPSTFVQTVGRITRKNTLFPDDLNVYIFRSDNIDLYKLMVVSAKTYQLELVQGHEANVPDDYKALMRKADMKDRMKKVLLWQK